MCTVWVVLATLISGIVSPLHRLEFSVDFSHSRYTRGDLERHIGMDAFDAALCGKNFAGLEQVKITFINLVDEEDHLLQDILKCLPRVNARSILCVDVQYESSDGANQAAEFTKWQNVPRNLCFRDDDPAKRSDATQGYRQRR
ncbi:hypothetical protein A0H81_06644 [Grifola frondosa]|uniref:Uncharacterized protein n=1 Tax=Grifola frondosa TaxID=5627 RepID=A0A1C7MAN5_GRIFR|nr:hypothetical protein A0H81_06644 [Grifola frondosa]